MPGGRPKKQTAFSDIVLQDEELENELMKIIGNQPSDEELERQKTVRQARKKVKEILEIRHKAELEGIEDNAWIRFDRIQVMMKPSLAFHPEETKQVTYNEGGKTEVMVEILPLAEQGGLPFIA